MSRSLGNEGSLDLGLDALDREHRGQLEQMDALERAIASGAPAREVERRVEDLVQYLKAHFTSEQIAMRESAYPAYEDHVREHDEAIEELLDLRERAPAARADALEALRHQLVEHVHTSDAALAAYLRRDATR